MPTWQRAYLIACAAVIGYSLAYVLCVFGDWPKLTYFPYERAFEFLERPPGPVPMNYIGVILWGLGGALVAAAIAAVACRFARRGLPARWLRLAGAWALTAFVFAGAFFTWHLWPF